AAAPAPPLSASRSAESASCRRQRERAPPAVPGSSTAPRCSSGRMTSSRLLRGSSIGLLYQHVERRTAKSTRSGLNDSPAALHETIGPHPSGPRGQLGRRATPAQCVHILEQRRVGPERREILEQQREPPLLAENLGREVFDRAVSIQQPCGRRGADSRKPRVAVSRVTDEREIVRNHRRRDAEFLTDDLFV